jgi:hypothetical protein
MATSSKKLILTWKKQTTPYKWTQDNFSCRGMFSFNPHFSDNCNVTININNYTNFQNRRQKNQTDVWGCLKPLTLKWCKILHSGNFLGLRLLYTFIAKKQTTPYKWTQDNFSCRGMFSFNPHFSDNCNVTININNYTNWIKC